MTFSRISALAQIMVATILLFGVGAINGRPSIFPDTAWYYSQGEYLAHALHLADASPGPDRRADPTSVLLGGNKRDYDLALTVIGARSPFYGLLIYLAHWAGSLWLLAGLQALATAWVLHLTWRAVFPERSGTTYLLAVAGLAFASSAPFFAAFMMPDIFVPLGVMALTVMMLYPERYRPWQFGALWGVLVAGLAFHATMTPVVLLTGAAGIIALAILKVRPGLVLLRSAVLGTAILTAVAANVGFVSLYQLDTGVSQSKPPFLMARVLADGPGRRYLKAACSSGEELALCDFANLPLTDSEDILWATDPERGVFEFLSPDGRRKLTAEEKGFVWRAIAHEPFGQLAASARNFLGQLALFYVEEPLRNPALVFRSAWWSRTSLTRIVPNLSECAVAPSRCETRLPVLWLSMFHNLVVALSTFAVVWALIRGDIRRMMASQGEGADDLKRLMAAVALLAVAVVANAAVCGVLSGPFARYQARIIWLVPLGAMMIAAGAWRSASAAAQRPVATLAAAA